MQLLVSLGRVLMSKGLKVLQPFGPLVPYGNIILEIAQDTWEDYTRNVGRCPAPGVPGMGGPVQPAPVSRRVEIESRIELESLVRATPAAVRQQVERVAEQVAGDQSPEVRQALANYLAQVPAMLRRSTRRPSDPTGTTLPGNLLLRKGEDLVALLPPRPPRFKSGDRPLPGVEWVLDELLGVGGFGEVWKAHHADDNGLLVALKFCLDEEAAKTLRNEFKVLVQVMQQGRHEGIIQLRNAHNMKAGTPCLEYEYVAGGDLAGLIQELHQKARPSADMAGKIMRRLAAIIGSVHQLEKPIVHRDLKPANILVQKSPAGKFQFKVADFGIGQVTAGEAILTSTRGGENRAGLLTAMVQGSYTPLYASPQQVRGDPADPRDDVYSLGVIWYQLLTGDLGSGAPSGMRWSRDLAAGGMTQQQIDLLASCFESNPIHRPAHAAVLAEQLASAQAKSAPAPPVVRGADQPPPVPPVPKSRSEPIQVRPGSVAEKKVLQPGTALVVVNSIMMPSGLIAFILGIVLFSTSYYYGYDSNYYGLGKGGYAYRTDHTKEGFGVLFILLGIGAELAAVVLFIIWLYRAWSVVSRPEDDPTPGMAIGLLFVPFFNFYWMFRVIPGLSAVLQRELHKRDPARHHGAGWGVGLAACIVALIPYVNVASVVLFPVWLNLANNAINRLVVAEDGGGEAGVGPSPVFSKNLLIGLACGLAGLFLIVLLVAIATIR